MVAADGWQELCRFNDLVLARAVATTIAAMEFDVELHSAGAHLVDDDPPRPPHVVLVAPGDRLALAAVLNEIVDEQQEFDRWVDEQRASGRHARIAVVLGLAGLGELVLILATLDR